MTPTVFVVSTVHWPDDTRIRERLIRSLAGDFQVVFAAKSPGPTDRTDLIYVELRGGRMRRNFRSLLSMLTRQWDILVVHDPELIPAAVLARFVKRRPVVFDVHEDFPSLAMTRRWVPRPLRSVLSGLVAFALRVGERSLTLTLAEPGYQRLFASEHPVFPNYPDSSDYPDVASERVDEAVYLGDATVERGVLVAAKACNMAGIPLRVVGRVSADTELELVSQASVLVEGVLDNPRAIRRISQASVGLVPLLDVPNYRHSQPTKVLEYLAVGLPVVASDLPGTRELVEGLDAVWLVPPGDAPALAEAMGQARARASISRAAEQAPFIRERFGWPTAQVVRFYQDLVSA